MTRFTPKPISQSHADSIARRTLEKVRIYTYQDPVAFEQLSDRGFLSGEHPLPDYPAAYDWIREELKDRIEGFSGDRPIWAWPRRHDNRYARQFKGPTIRITAIVPTTRLVISDFDRWHNVLVGGYLPMNDADDLAVAERYPVGAPDSFIRSSWTRIFELCSSLGDRPRIWQLCVDRLYASEIVDVLRYETASSQRRGQVRRALRR